jgi:hypothetical protein
MLADAAAPRPTSTPSRTQPASTRLVTCVLALVMSSRMQGQVPPPAPRSYAECDQFKSQIDNESNQLVNEFGKCQDSLINGCIANNDLFAIGKCYARVGCNHDMARPEHSPCGDVSYTCTSCAKYAYDSQCVQQNGYALYHQCYAQVKAYLAGQQASGQLIQQSAVQQAGCRPVGEVNGYL